MYKKTTLPLRKGVGIILLNKSNQILVGKRIDNPSNFWQNPGEAPKDETKRLVLKLALSFPHCSSILFLINFI